MRVQLLIALLALAVLGVAASRAQTRGGVDYAAYANEHQNGERIDASDDTVLLAAPLSESDSNVDADADSEPAPRSRPMHDEGIRPMIYEAEPQLSSTMPAGFRFRSARRATVGYSNDDQDVAFGDLASGGRRNSPQRRTTGRFPELEWDMTKRQVEIATMGVKDLLHNVDKLKSSVRDHAFKNDWSFLQFQDQVNNMNADEVLQNMERLRKEREELLRAKEMVQLELGSHMTSTSTHTNKHASTATASASAAAARAAQRTASQATVASVETVQSTADLPSDDAIRSLADVDHLGETMEWEDTHRVRAVGSDVDSLLGDSQQLLGRLKSKYDDKARLYQ